MGGGLTSLGRKQADFTGRRLLEDGMDELFHSPMERSRESARIIRHLFPKVPVHVTHALAEISPPWPDSYQCACPHREEEISDQLSRLMERFFHSARDHQRRECFVSHGNLIRCLICRAMGIPRENWLRIQLDHGSLTVFEVTANHEVLLHTLNDTGHIPSHLKSRDQA